MKALFISLILTSTIFCDSIVKDDADINTILQRIDSIAKNIQQRELEEQKLMQEQNKAPIQPEPINTQTSEEEKLQMELLKKEQELELKQKKLDLEQREQDYYQKISNIKERSFSYLSKKTDKMISDLKKELYKLKKAQNITINIKKYMKIGDLSYAYIPKNKFDEVKVKLVTNQKKIENIKKTIKKLQLAKESNIDRWFQVVNSLDNNLQEQTDIQNLASTIPPATEVAKSYIKVQTGDTIDNIFIKKVSENRVVLTFTEH